MFILRIILSWLTMCCQFELFSCAIIYNCTELVSSSWSGDCSHVYGGYCYGSGSCTHCHHQEIYCGTSCLVNGDDICCSRGTDCNPCGDPDWRHDSTRQYMQKTFNVSGYTSLSFHFNFGYAAQGTVSCVFMKEFSTSSQIIVYPKDGSDISYTNRQFSNTINVLKSYEYGQVLVEFSVNSGDDYDMYISDFYLIGSTTSPTESPTNVPTTSPIAVPTLSPIIYRTISSTKISKTVSINIAQSTGNYWQFYIILIVSIITLLVMVLNKLYNKNKLCSDSVGDKGNAMPFCVFITQVWDFYSDIALIIDIFMYKQNWDNFNVRLCAYGFIIFTFIPYIANLLSIYYIYNHPIIQNNHTSLAFLRENLKVFVSFVVISGGSFPAIALMSSYMFGIHIFCSGLSSFEVADLSSFKIYLSVMAENMPQIVIQIIYSSLVETITNAVIFSFIGSSLSLIISLVTYIVQSKSKNMKLVIYHLQLNSESNTLNNQQIETIKVKNRLLFSTLSRNISEIYGIPASLIEIKSAHIQRGTLIINIAQQISKLHLQKFSDTLKQQRKYTFQQDDDSNSFQFPPMFYIRNLIESHQYELKTKICQFYCLHNQDFEIKLITKQQHIQLFTEKMHEYVPLPEDDHQL